MPATKPLPSSAALPGDPTAATASPGDSDTSLATTAFVTAALVAVRSDTTAAYTSPYAPDADSHGFNAIIRITMTGNLTLNVPANGTAGQRIRYVLTASGAERTITLGSGIKTLNGATFTGAVTSTHVRVIEIEKQDIGWLAVKNQQFTP